VYIATLPMTAFVRGSRTLPHRIRERRSGIPERLGISPDLGSSGVTDPDMSKVKGRFHMFSPTISKEHTVMDYAT
jgi:hypothetical protein